MDIWGEIKEDYEKEFENQLKKGEETNNARWKALQYCTKKINSYGDMENIINQALHNLKIGRKL